MARIGAEYFAELPPVLVARNALGKSLTVKRETHSFIVEIPESPNQYQFDYAGSIAGSGEPEPPSLAYTGVSDHDFVTLRIVRIVVNLDADVSAASYDESRDRKRVDAAFYRAWNYAVDAAREFTDYVRIEGNQPWLEPSGKYPRIINLVALVDISETGAPRSFGFKIGKSPSTLRVFDNSQLLDSDTFEAIAASMASTGPLSVGELLVGEARYLLETEQVSAPEQATLLAGVGVETQTKHVLRTIAQSPQTGLLELLLEHPRDWSMAAHQLFRTALPELAGRDFGTSHRDLAKRVQRLFEARNRVAHRGEFIARAAAREHVDAAVDAMVFLRTVPRPAGPP